MTPRVTSLDKNRRWGWVVGLVALAGCIGDDPRSAGPVTSTQTPINAVALAATPAGDYLWAELGGSVWRADGTNVGQVDVSTDGQRGLVGLAVDADDRVYVGYTAPDLTLVIAELSDEGERIVWLGPETVQGGNGGRIGFDLEGRLIVGVGLLNDRAGQADPDDVAGKMIRLDPEGRADQQPEILSGPWNNPFAFDIAPDGTLWVADNHPQDGAERIAKGNDGFQPAAAATLPSDSAPTGLAAVDDEVWICTYNTRQLLRYVDANGRWQLDGSIAADCQFDVEVLTDGSVVYSTGSAIVRVER